MNKSDNNTIEYDISICSPLNNSRFKECDGKHICKYSKKDNRAIGEFPFDPNRVIYFNVVDAGYEPKSAFPSPLPNAKIESAMVEFEGPKCDEDPLRNYTIIVSFTCGRHLVCLKLLLQSCVH